jgi:hypothetical protein
MVSTNSEGRQMIGTMAQWHWPGKDWAKINATGTWADTAPWPTWLAYWGVSQEYPINGEARSYNGQTLCHSGANTGSSCGIVSGENIAVEYIGGEKLTGMFEVNGKSLCVGPGDSGGPFFANNIALGILSGGGPDGCNTTIFFSDIMAADAELNVNLAGSGAPEAITGAPSNLQPTQATVSGQINPHGLSTSYRFDFGVGSYTSSSALSSAGSGQGFVAVSATLTGLRPMTTYKYRITGTNSLNTAYGAEGTFQNDAGHSGNLVGIDMNITGEHHTGVHVLSGATEFQTWLTQRETPLGETTANQWHFLMEEY